MELLEGHPDLLRDDSTLTERLKRCQVAVALAESFRPATGAHCMELRRMLRPRGQGEPTLPEV